MKKINAFVDGSFHEKSKRIGSGIVFVDPITKKVIHTVKAEIKHPDVKRLRNVAGELGATMRAIIWAERNGYDEIEIHYDYNGNEKWITGEWKCKDIHTLAYREFIIKHKKQITITFHKVQAHNGDTFNEFADRLAKLACGNKIK